MASEPYCAAAPSRSTSTPAMAMPGRLPMSTPCGPKDPKRITAPRCRRLPFTSTSAWCESSPRKFVGRMNEAPSAMG